jgi:hypothetical protein
MAVSARIAVRVRSAFGLALGVLIGSVLIPIAALVVVLSRLYGRNFGRDFCSALTGLLLLRSRYTHRRMRQIVGTRGPVQPKSHSH